VRDGVTVAVRVAPRAARERIGEVVADGGRVIKLSVTAAPERGKANQAAIRLLAKAWLVPKSSLSVVSGATERRKTIHVAGEPEDLVRRLTEWIESRHG
jgi:uncharacterized protein (TIGR00251 family)